MSDVALLNKLRNSEGWLHWMCVGLLAKRDLAMPVCAGMRMRLIDGTDVKEPGLTGHLWRLHYSICVPDFTCDSFKLTPTKGVGSGETLRQFDVAQGDCLIADRGYGNSAGIAHVRGKGGHVIVRLNTRSLPMEEENGSRFDLLEHVRSLATTGQSEEWPVWIKPADGKRIALRLCAVRKSREAALLAQRKQQASASRKSHKLKDATLEYAQWVMVLTSVEKEKLDTHAVLEWYRVRWQIELAFKRMKTLANLGHVPKYDDTSSRAWLYGKLLVVLLTEQMQQYAKPFSPWGCAYEPDQNECNEEDSPNEKDETACEQMA